MRTVNGLMLSLTAIKIRERNDDRGLIASWMTKDEFLKIAFEHLSQNVTKRRIKQSTTTEYNVDINKFSFCIDDVRMRLRVKLTSGFCSDLLINQLARHLCSLGEKFQDSTMPKGESAIEYFNTPEILNVLECIENRKIVGKQFRREPLKGLYKVHHGAFSGLGYSLMHNIRKYWFNDHGIVHRKREIQLVGLIKEVGLGSFSALMNRMHDQVYSEKLTGEWIVFALHEGKHYYLCLANHNEGDEFIHENKIRQCYEQFPFLQ